MKNKLLLMAFALFGSSFVFASDSSEIVEEYVDAITPCSDFADRVMERVEDANPSLSSNELLEIRDAVEAGCNSQMPLL